jgi:hypothetical protein
VIYRPQFAYAPVQGCLPEQFSYTFDSTNVAQLGVAIPANSQVLSIPLVLQPDAPFSWRGFKFDQSSLSMRLQDPWGNFLENDFTLIDLYTAAQGNDAVGALPAVWEPSIECPAGAVIRISFNNPTSGSVTPGKITLLGIKRRDPSLARCA